MERKEEMKKLEQFQCEFCKTIYNDRLTTANCENSHKKVVSVKKAWYRSFTEDRKGYPLKLEITMSDGETIIYKR